MAGPSWPTQSVPITTKVVRSNPAHDEEYTLQPYVITFAFLHIVVLSGYSGFLHQYILPPLYSGQLLKGSLTTTPLPLPNQYWKCWFGYLVFLLRTIFLVFQLFSYEGYSRNALIFIIPLRRDAMNGRTYYVDKPHLIYV